jgi:hypothetical protein
VNVRSTSSIGSQPGLVPSSRFGFQLRYGKMRLQLNIERRAGIVTIASGKARSKRTPRSTIASMFGVFTSGEP